MNIERVKGFLINRDWFIISSASSDAPAGTDRHEKRVKAIDKYLRDRGFAFIRGTGWYTHKGETEPRTDGTVFLVDGSGLPDLGRRLARDFARQYHQESFLTVFGLFDNEGKELGWSDGTILWGDEARAHDAWTEHADGVAWAVLLWHGTVGAHDEA